MSCASEVTPWHPVTRNCIGKSTKRRILCKVLFLMETPTSVVTHVHPLLCAWQAIAWSRLSFSVFVSWKRGVDGHMVGEGSATISSPGFHDILGCSSL
mgnify:CR=1 FL=1